MIKLLVLLSTLLIAVPVYSASLTLDWTDNSELEDGTAIERKLGATDDPFAEIGRVGPNVVTHVDFSLDSSTTYCYRVRAFNVTGFSGYSNVGCGTTPDVGVPNTPSALQISVTITITVPLPGP